MDNYFLIEHNYSHSVIYNFKPELKIWKNYSVVKIIILLILISQILYNNNIINFFVIHCL